MAQYFLVTTKDEQAMIFQSKGRRHTKDITPIGDATLNNSMCNYYRLPEVAYYLNIIANGIGTKLPWQEYKEEIVNLAKKVDPNCMDWQEFILDNDKELRRAYKEYPEVFGNEWDEY